MTTTSGMKKTMRKKKKRATRLKVKKMKTTYQDAVADVAWQAITTCSRDIMTSRGTPSITCCHRGRRTSSRFLGSRVMFPGCLWCITTMCLWR
jgi:hypothetical protein